MAGKPMGRPRKLTPKQVQERVDQYFATTQPPWTITGLCLALEIDRQTLYNWIKERGAYSAIMRKAHDQVQNYWEGLLSSIKTARGAEFWLRCAGWDDGSRNKKIEAESNSKGILKVTISSSGDIKNDEVNV